MTTKIETNYYEIEGKSSQQLKRQMWNFGPNGYWSYVNWYIDWETENCRVSLKIVYTYPKWTDIHQVSKSKQQKWQQLISALITHEIGHARHGVEAAWEISKNNCRNTEAIIEKWTEQDKIYDQRTRHGLTQGVKLP